MAAAALGALFDEGPVAMAVVDGTPPFRLRAANARFVEAVGATAGSPSIEDRPLLEVMPDAAAAGLEAALGNVAKDGQPQVLVVASARADYRLRYW
jgi:hypothetical protein